MSYQQGPYSQPPQYYPGPPPRRTNGLAIAALVTGLTGFITCGFTSLLAVIFGHTALRQIRRDGTDGREMAFTGLVLGWILTGLWILYWGLVAGGMVASFIDMANNSGPQSAPTPDRTQLSITQPAATPPTEPETDTASEPPSPPPPPATSEAPADSPPRPAKVGETLTLHGLTSGLQVDVTVARVVDPATPASEFLKPQEGSRYVAVEVRLNNSGQSNYTDAPSNGAKLIDDQGQQYRAAFGEVREGVLLTTLAISPGDSRKGMLVFEVPDGAKLVKLQFALNSGFADQQGEWTLQ